MTPAALIAAFQLFAPRVELAAQIPTLVIEPRFVARSTAKGLIVAPGTPCIVEIVSGGRGLPREAWKVTGEYSLRFPCVGWGLAAKYAPSDNVDPPTFAGPFVVIPAPDLTWPPCDSPNDRPDCSICHTESLRFLILADGKLEVDKAACPIVVKVLLLHPSSWAPPPQEPGGLINPSYGGRSVVFGFGGPADVDLDGDVGTDGDIETAYLLLEQGAFDFNADGEFGTDDDLVSFWRAIGGA